MGGHHLPAVGQAVVADAAIEHVHRGIALQSQQRFDEALACYERAATLRPDDAVLLQEVAMGITGNLAAIANPPHLTAAFVVVAPTSLKNASFIGGAFKQKDSGDWSRDQGVAEDVIAKNAASYPASAEYAALDIQRNAEFIDIPIYNLGGWYDIFNEGSVRNFMKLQHEGSKGAKGNQKLEMGPFGHGELSGDMEYPESGGLRGNPTEIRWFDYWLKGIDNGIMNEPPVKAYMMASARKGAISPKNRWMTFGDWPPAPSTVDYFLGLGGKLSVKAPTSASASKTYAFDPKNPVPSIGGANLTFDRGPMDQRPIGKRADYLRFETPVLDKDVAIAGPVSVDLWASTDGPDTDFMVKLVDVYPDGYEAIVLDSAIRTRYRDGRNADDIKMMVPGAPVKPMPWSGGVQAPAAPASAASAPQAAASAASK